MSAEAIDRLALAVAGRGSRRTFLASVMAAAGTLFAGKRLVSAGGECTSDADCDPTLACLDGFCLAPGCTDAGGGCTAHHQCCEGLTCNSGVCSTSPRCAAEGQSCDAGCCPGLTCSAGICATAPPPPPENSGNPGNNGGNNGGNSGGSSGGGGGVPSSGGGGGITTGGVSVSSLPSTGHGPQSHRASPLLGAVAAAAAFIGVHVRRSASTRDDSSEDVSTSA